MAVWVAQVADGINVRAERYGQRQGLVQPDRILYPEAPCVWTAGMLDPMMGEECLRKGDLDFVGMTRRLLADPELPNKVKENRCEDIRWCSGCLHCLDVRNKNQKLECRVNGRCYARWS